MNLIGLVIHGTTRGVDDLYVSENFKEIVEGDEVSKTTIDERLLTTKLSKQSDVYTMQLTSNYRVYSLIVTDITDFVGRAGFYAIRIYVPKKYPLPNIESLFDEINKRYLEFESDGTPKENHNYDDLLIVDLPLEVKQQDFLHLKSSEESFCYYDATDLDLGTIFNSKNVAFFNKIYAFDRHRAQSAETIKSLGLKSFEDIEQNIKQIVISNHDRVLKELKINNIPIEFNANETELNLLTKQGDFLEYNTTDNPKFKEDSGFFITVTKKRTYSSAPKEPTGPKPPGFFVKYRMYLVLLVMVSAIGYFGWPIVFPKVQSTQYYEPIEQEKDKPTVVDTVSHITFERDTSDLKNKVYLTKYPKLDKYRFRLDSKKWSYKNTSLQNIYVKFNINVIDNFGLNEKEKKELIEKLKESSQEPIEDVKPAEVIVKKPTTVKEIEKTTKSEMPKQPKAEVPKDEFEDNMNTKTKKNK